MKANRRRTTEGDLSSFSEVEQRSGEEEQVRGIGQLLVMGPVELFPGRAALGRGKASALHYRIIIEQYVEFFRGRAALERGKASA